MFNDKAASLIRASWSGHTFNHKKFSRGETVIFFPKGLYRGIDEATGEKVFQHTYLRPEDIGNYPQLADLHTRLNYKYGREISNIRTPKR